MMTGAPITYRAAHEKAVAWAESADIERGNPELCNAYANLSLAYSAIASNCLASRIPPDRY